MSETKKVVEEPSSPPSHRPEASYSKHPYGVDWVWVTGSVTALAGIAARYLYKYFLEPWWVRQEAKLRQSLDQERRIINTLAQILLVLKADRCLLIQYDLKTKPYPTIFCNHEICSPGVSTISSLVYRANLCTQQSYDIAYNSKQPIFREVSQIENLKYKNFLLSIGVLEVLTIPIKFENYLYGCIIVHWTEKLSNTQIDLKQIEQQVAIISDILLSLELEA